MYRIIIALVTLAVCTNVYGQSMDQKLLDLEYAFYTAPSVEGQNSALIEKIDLYLSQTILSEEIQFEIQRVEHESLSADEKKRFLWNASLASYLLHRPSRSLHYLEFYKGLEFTDSLQVKMLEYLLYAELDRNIATGLYENLLQQDSTLKCLECIDEVLNYELPHKQFRLIASLFIPGVGTMSAGKPGKGLLSLALNTLTVMTIVYTVQQQLWVNTVSWGTNLMGKFYAGNIRLADKTIQEKEQLKKKELAIDCELQIKEVIRRYSLAFVVIQ